MIHTKKYFFSAVILTWIILFYFAHQAGLTKSDFQSIEKVIKAYDDYNELIFFLLFTFRVLLLIPSTIFMIAGGIVFSPIKAVALGITAIIVTETGIFLLGKLTKNSTVYRRIVRKYPKVFNYIEYYRLPYFILTLLCPIIPMDVACFAVSTTQMKYLAYITGIIIGNVPLHILYSLFGSSLISSPLLVTIVGIAILIIGGTSIFFWNLMTKKYEKEGEKQRRGGIS